MSDVDKTYALIHKLLQPYRIDYPHYRVPKDIYKAVVELYESTGLQQPLISGDEPPYVVVYDPIDNLPVMER